MPNGCDGYDSPRHKIRVWPAERASHFGRGHRRRRTRFRLRFTRSTRQRCVIRPRAQPDLIQKAAQWLIEAENPVFVVGAEVGVEGAQDEMLALAEKLSVPVTETSHSLYANFPNYHPLFLGELGGLARYPRKQDLLISFGDSFTTTQADPLKNVPVVHISHDPNTLGRPMALDWPFCRK